MGGLGKIGEEARALISMFEKEGLFGSPNIDGGEAETVGSLSSCP
jgi:hypothetical protein